MPGGSRPRAAAWGPAASNWRHLRSLGRFPLFVAQLKAWFVPLNPAGRHLEADGGGTREARQPGERLLCRSPCVEVGDEDPAAAPGGSCCDHGALLLSGRSPAGERIPPVEPVPFYLAGFLPSSHRLGLQPPNASPEGSALLLPCPHAISSSGP